MSDGGEVSYARSDGGDARTPSSPSRPSRVQARDGARDSRDGSLVSSWPSWPCLIVEDLAPVGLSSARPACYHASLLRLVMRERGIKHTMCTINIREPREHRPEWFKALSKTGTIPAIVHEGVMYPTFDEAIAHVTKSDESTTPEQKKLTEKLFGALVGTILAQKSGDADSVAACSAIAGEVGKLVGQEHAFLGGHTPNLADLALAALVYRADVWCRVRHGARALLDNSSPTYSWF